MRPAVRLLLILGVSVTVVAAGLRALAVPLDRVSSDLWLAKAMPLDDLGELSERSIVYDRDGNVLTVLRAEENRKPVKLSEVPQAVVHAILDVEDENFYSHKGVDVRSMARAFLTNADAGEVRQGGSTITQQVVKNLLLTPERSVDRKVKEAVLATRLEKKFSKDEILEQYLNLVYLGNGAYGVQAGSETYFGKSVGELTAVEGAFLAGLIRNPLANDPLRNPEQALDRRNTALQQMVKNGHLSQAEADELKKVPIPTALTQTLPQRESYFIEGMKQRLLDDPRLGETPVDRYNAVFRGGLRIYTTFDPRAQAEADRAVEEGVPSGRLNRLGVVGALAAVEPTTGAIRAVVGGPGFDDFKYDIATHHPGRQPGSTFKVFTLLAALEAGYGPQSAVDGSGPCIVNDGQYNSRGRRVRAGRAQVINNAGDTIGGGTMSMASATSGSVNCAFERMAATVGIEKVAEMAKRLGVTSPIDLVPSMVIGSEEVTPLQMAAAYAAIANDGIYHAPTYVDRVVDRHGKELFRGTDEGKRVLTQNVARMAAQIMKGVFNGTARGQSLRGRPAAGKTGTTNDYTNAWFVGYTPHLSTAVWIGDPHANRSMRGLGGRGAIYGATYSAPIWRDFMNAYHAELPVVDFAAPNARAFSNKPFRLPPGAFILPGSGGGAVASSSRSARSRPPATRRRSTATSPRSPSPTRPPATTAPPTTKKPPPTTAAGGGDD